MRDNIVRSKRCGFYSIYFWNRGWIAGFVNECFLFYISILLKLQHGFSARVFISFPVLARVLKCDNFQNYILASFLAWRRTQKQSWLTFASDNMPLPLFLAQLFTVIVDCCLKFIVCLLIQEYENLSPPGYQFNEMFQFQWCDLQLRIKITIYFKLHVLMRRDYIFRHYASILFCLERI